MGSIKLIKKDIKIKKPSAEAVKNEGIIMEWPDIKKQYRETFHFMGGLFIAGLYAVFFGFWSTDILPTSYFGAIILLMTCLCWCLFSFFFEIRHKQYEKALEFFTRQRFQKKK